MGDTARPHIKVSFLRFEFIRVPHGLNCEDVMKLLADHKDYRITHHPAQPSAAQPDTPLVITFGGQPSGLADTGFGSGFVMGHGWDHIYVAQRAKTQYQGLSAQDFRTAVAPQCEGRDVVCYGSSLGAYAALYYGGQIDARIIAAAPLLPAWKPLDMAAYADVPVNHVPLQHSRRSRHAPVVIYDPVQQPDVKMLNGMVRPTYADIREVALPFSGHTVLITLSRARLIKDLIGGLILDDRIPALDLPTLGSDIWHRERGKALAKTHPEHARKEMERALQITVSKGTASALLSILIKLGDMQAAQALIDRCAADDDPQMSVVSSIAVKAARLGLRVPDSLLQSGGGRKTAAVSANDQILPFRAPSRPQVAPVVSVAEIAGRRSIRVRSRAG